MAIISASNDKWLVNKYIRSDFQVFDNEVVIYQQGSGFTHLINSFGAEILKLLLVKPRSVDDLTEILIESSDGVEKKEMNKYVQEYLEHCLLLDIVNHQHNES